MWLKQYTGNPAVLLYLLYYFVLFIIRYFVLWNPVQYVICVISLGLRNLLRYVCYVCYVRVTLRNTHVRNQFWGTYHVTVTLLRVTVTRIGYRTPT